MKPTMIEHSRATVGRVWTEAHHRRLVAHLAKVDQLAQQVFDKNLVSGPKGSDDAPMNRSDLAGGISISPFWETAPGCDDRRGAVERIRQLLEEIYRRPFPDSELHQVLKRLFEGFDEAFRQQVPYEGQWEPHYTLYLLGTAFRAQRWTRPEIRRALAQLDERRTGLFDSQFPDEDED